ncbi:hypothetical protein MPQ_1311 [Methylovorus sp. MP688]|nr:hypothetical protein MPQ_1311 [Methylovorus sp. MP688]
MMQTQAACEAGRGAKDQGGRIRHVKDGIRWAINRTQG